MIEFLEEIIIIKEKPDAILTNYGWSNWTLMLAMEAWIKKGILKKYNVELIGANAEAIDNAENREQFKKNMT